MTTQSTSMVRLAGLLAVVLGVLVVMTVAFVDGPAPPAAFAAVVSVHDSMIPPQTTASTADAPPRLVAAISVREDRVIMQSEMLRWRGRWFSVHRLQGQPDVPPQAHTVRAGEPPMVAFDVADLTLITWLRGGLTVAVASSADEREILQLAQLVDTPGWTAEAAPDLTPPPRPLRPGAPPDAGPGPAPTPR